MQYMTYNLHPLFVHFPIALLFVYSLIQILPVRKFLPSVNWAVVGRVLLIIGVAGAFASLATGEVAEHLVKPNHDIVEAHAGFAVATTWIYVALLLQEFLSWYVVARPMSKLSGVQKFLSNKILVFVLSVVALVTLTVTGVLGGTMAHGTGSDPLAPTILKLLGIDL